MFALLILLFSCQHQEEVAPANQADISYQQVSEGFEQMFEGALQMAASLELLSVVDRDQELLTLKMEFENTFEQTNKFLDQYFKGLQGIRSKPSYPLAALNTLFLDDQSAFRTFKSMVDTADILNTVQKMYIISLGTEILAAQTPSLALEEIGYFREKVVNSDDLNHQQRILLLEFVAGSKVLLEFLQNGEVLKTSNNIAFNLYGDVPISRTAACSVNWRSIWMDGVVGLVGGAVWGGYIGGTAGTFTVPVLGTAAGAVGGAVFGGASGFISGVSYGVASDLLTTCFRKSSSVVQTFSGCNQAWAAYDHFEIKELPADCFRISIPIKDLY